MSKKTKKQAKLNEKQLYFLKTGTKFGYPQCCVKAFLKDLEQFEQTGKIKRAASREKWAFQGFVPCEAHAKLIQKNGYAYMAAGINHRRKKTYPFPFPIDNEMLMEVVLAPLAMSVAEQYQPTHIKDEECVCNNCKPKELNPDNNAESIQVSVSNNG